jgi:hypothetical protein
VVHQVVELNSVERRGAAQSGNLAVDVIEQVPELQQHRAREASGRPAQGKAGGGSERDEHGQSGDRVRRNSPGCYHPGDT